MFDVQSVTQAFLTPIQHSKPGELDQKDTLELAKVILATRTQCVEKYLCSSFVNRITVLKLLAPQKTGATR